jgi:hypothetical protein
VIRAFGAHGMFQAKAAVMQFEALEKSLFVGKPTKQPMAVTRVLRATSLRQVPYL